jgi:WD40 repeat protein
MTDSFPRSQGSLPRWETDGARPLTALVPREDGVDAFANGTLVATYDAAGQKTKTKPRSDRVKKGGGRTIVAGDVSATLDDDGALVFTSIASGETLGALRLASTEPPDTWRIASISARELVLALGEWLVWVDAATRKVVRRVRARAKVRALAADAELVVAGCEGGAAQIFRATTGEARGTFTAHADEIAALALGPDAIFTAGPKGNVRAWDRAALDVGTAKAAEPITALHAHKSLLITGDRGGRVRLVRGDRDEGTLAVGDAVALVRVARDETALASSSRLAIQAAKPWSAPRPIILRETATALAADDDYLFAGTATGAVDVYDLERSSHVTTHRLTDADVSALARLPGALLVVGTGALDGTIFVIDVVEAKIKSRVAPHDDAFGVTCLASDVRGRIVASGSDEGTIVLLDPAKGKVLARLRVRETPAAIAFEPTGRRLACVFADGNGAVVSLGPKGATMDDLYVRGAVRVTWADDLVIGFADGRVERPEIRPSATMSA